ncbi:MAG: hypothetical protein ACHQII_02125 [Bacteroidia bacterium]
MSVGVFAQMSQPRLDTTRSKQPVNQTKTLLSLGVGMSYPLVILG